MADKENVSTQASQGETQPVRGSRSADLRESLGGGEVGATGSSDSAGRESQRAVRAAWAWANLSVHLVGGILRQLIEDVRGQLAAHEDSVAWYQGEMEKAIAGRDWHENRKLAAQQRLQSLLELQAAVDAVEDDDSGHPETDASAEAE